MRSMELRCGCECGNRVVGGSAGPIEDLPHVFNLPCDGVLPGATAAIGIHRSHPALRRRSLHVREVVEALGFDDKMGGGSGVESDNEIRHVVVGLAVVEIEDGEP